MPWYFLVSTILPAFYVFPSCNGSWGWANYCLMILELSCALKCCLHKWAERGRSLKIVRWVYVIIEFVPMCLSLVFFTASHTFYEMTVWGVTASSYLLIIVGLVSRRQVRRAKHGQSK